MLAHGCLNVTPVSLCNVILADSRRRQNFRPQKAGTVDATNCRTL